LKNIECKIRKGLRTKDKREDKKKKDEGRRIKEEEFRMKKK
jgi:hypothetical protein